MPDTDRSDESRVMEAVHYVIAKADPGKLGYVRLNRILWLADIKYNRSHGVSITGLRQYSRMPQGPMAQEITLAVGRLVREGKVAEPIVTLTDYVRREMTSVAEPDSSAFSTEQLDILDEMTAIVTALTAFQLNQITQDDPLWRQVRNREAMLVATGSVTTRLPKLR